MYTSIEFSSHITTQRGSLVRQIRGLIQQFGGWLKCDLKIRLNTHTIIIYWSYV
jgi:hypothetical protein